MPKLLSILFTALLATPVFAHATGNFGFNVTAAHEQISKTLDKQYPLLETIYKDLHAHPELGFQETRTASVLAAEMRKLGFEVTENVGKTGVVAIYKNGDGPTVLVRTELDGLPMEEKTELPYASHAHTEVNGRTIPLAHSCGHDIHMTWWLGSAAALVSMKDQWQGTLMFIGQPSEETLAGAQAMLKDGLFTRWPKPDYGFAAHVSPAPAGKVSVRNGVVTSAADMVNITFYGRGAHGSMPEKSIDPVVMGSRFVSDVQSIISREKNPRAFGVITVGSFTSGTVNNIIPDRADLKLSLRSQDNTTRELLREGVKRTARAVADMAHAPAPTVEHIHGVNAVHNDANLSARTAAVLETAIGKDVTFFPASEPGFSASEDFSEFVDAGVPSVYFGIGGNDPQMMARHKKEGKPLPVNHSPDFAPVPEPTIKSGAQTLTLAVLTAMAKGKPQ